MRYAIAATTLAILAPAFGAAVPASASPPSASPLNASCGRAGPNVANHRVNDAPSNGTANQRSGSSTSCTAPGALQPSDDAIYFCWTRATDGSTWTYLRNIRTGVQGWVRDDLLKENGAAFAADCGF
jgi:hypothetical protein